MKKTRKYTAIYVESWQCYNTKFCRIKVKPAETVLDALKRHKIDQTTIYLFKGWAMLEGEICKPVERYYSKRD